jgi:hypothetical protein
MGGNNNVGGGGSVRWSISADKVDKDLTSDAHTGLPGRGQHNQEGEDQDGVVGQDSFRVRIKFPPGNARAFPNLDWDGDTATFTVGMLNDRNQINIRWGEE